MPPKPPLPRPEAPAPPPKPLGPRPVAPWDVYERAVISRLDLRSQTTVMPELDDEARMWTTEGFHASDVMLSSEREREPGEKGDEGDVRSQMRICCAGCASQ